MSKEQTIAAMNEWMQEKDVAALYSSRERTEDELRIYELMDKALALLEAQEWVPVSERLPEPGQEVVYYFEFVGCWVGQYLGDGTNNVFGGKFGFLTDDVTHWMPLPTPPSEGG